MIIPQGTVVILTRTMGVLAKVGHVPQPLQFIIAKVAYAINERIACSMDSVLKKAHVLRKAYSETYGRKRLVLTHKHSSVAGHPVCPETPRLAIVA